MVIFLTGGSGGIGSKIKSTLKKAGIKVVAPTSKELNLNNNFEVDYPPVDGFIHCAGMNKITSHALYKSEIFEINTFSFVRLCNQLNINNNGNIIAIGSLYATQTKENRIPYVMSKHALYGAIKTLALEKASQNIKVNMVSPGFVLTEMTYENNDKKRIEYLKNNIPLGFTSPEDIANLCLFMIKQNRAITGQNIIVDGGYSLKGI